MVIPQPETVFAPGDEVAGTRVTNIGSGAARRHRRGRDAGRRPRLAGHPERRGIPDRRVRLRARPADRHPEDRSRSKTTPADWRTLRSTRSAWYHGTWPRHPGGRANRGFDSADVQGPIVPRLSPRTAIRSHSSPAAWFTATAPPRPPAVAAPLDQHGTASGSGTSHQHAEDHECSSPDGRGSTRARLRSCTPQLAFAGLRRLGPARGASQQHGDQDRQAERRRTAQQRRRRSADHERAERWRKKKLNDEESRGPMPRCRARGLRPRLGRRSHNARNPNAVFSEAPSSRTGRRRDDATIPTGQQVPPPAAPEPWIEARVRSTACMELWNVIIIVPLRGSS